MKKRMLMLFVTLFALTPALLGSTAWGIENRGKHGEKQECELMAAKHLGSDATVAAKRDVRKDLGGKTNL